MYKNVCVMHQRYRLIPSSGSNSPITLSQSKFVCRMDEYILTLLHHITEENGRITEVFFPVILQYICNTKYFLKLVCKSETNQTIALNCKELL